MSLNRFFKISETLIFSAFLFFLAFLISFGWANPSLDPPNGSGSLYVSGAGEVGIGIDPSTITPPISKLTVTGPIHSTTGGFKFPDSTTQTVAAAGGGSLWATLGANIYNSNSGNVGIGIPTPNYGLQVFGDDATPPNFKVGSGSGLFSGLMLTSASNLGIGRTNPTEKVQIASGDLYIETINRGLILRATDDSSKCFRITVNNAGTVEATALTSCP